MTNIKRIALSAAFTLILAPVMGVQAQTPRMSSVNISARTDKVRISGEGDVSELRIDVADEQGDVVFQSGAITGQQLDWNMKDTSGERVAAGTYLVTVTFRTATGKLRKRVEQITVDDAEKTSTKETADPQAVQADITGAGTTGKIAKFTGAATIGNSVITESAGKIGIGTATPISPLTVQTGPGFYGITHANGTAASAIKLSTYIGGSSSGATGGWLGTQSNHALHFFTNNSQSRMMITPSGKVGIGTTNPVNGMLHVDGGSGIAVYGSSSFTGVHGKGTYGVVGDGTYGVYGNGVSYGVYGSSTSGYAGYFSGKAKVTGKLEAAGGLTVTGACTGCSRLQSNQHLKANFSTINPRLVLDRLAALPIRAWNYKSDDSSVRHIGAMAQDFRSAFNLGVDDKHIDMIDANGVTMAAIQGLYQIVQEKDRQIERLQARVTRLEQPTKKRQSGRKRARK